MLNEIETPYLNIKNIPKKVIKQTKRQKCLLHLKNSNTTASDSVIHHSSSNKNHQTKT